MDIINLIKQQTPEERQALFSEFIKLLNKKREYVNIPERIVCSVCQVFVDTRDGTNEDGSEIIHEVYGLRHYDPFMRKQIKELEKQYNYALLNWEQGFLTNKGRFVDRKEAMEIAKAQNQVIRLSGSPNSDILFSEDLY
ncbi:hypothetical protein DPV88_00695 [Haemophilus parainfluenzae]|uniref:hypothetical protein n=1 Tax=Haemophilus parainfluenzae TaxID=729 RepID=UPI000DABC244|nr:hypothetical protein [Haemophilus parainfluenzae]RDE81487.1 hypothetical protein DPV88_00695 [Haemophilus parainfluenzae]